MHPNAQLLTRFYSAFRDHDAATMIACYHPEAVFSDEIFPRLDHDQVCAMWAMLLSRGASMSLEFDGIDADDQRGQAHWVARYKFSQTGRDVVNDIHAAFEFRDGQIVRHVDRFDFWRWSEMALGASGWLLGWSSFLRRAVQRRGAQGLAQWLAQHPPEAGSRQTGA